MTYDGKPVPYGVISFTPNAEKGNSGPQASGYIDNGSYKTLPGSGTIGGPQLVHITAYDGKQPEGPDAPMMPHGRLLAEYRSEVDLPKEASSKDFSIPVQPNR